jgi:hypothetical protein
MKFLQCRNTVNVVIVPCSSNFVPVLLLRLVNFIPSSVNVPLYLFQGIEQNLEGC